MPASTSTSTPATLYHCPCLPSTSSLAYHPLPTLYFCEECDSVRCPDCVTEEVSSYYCPNCLFEVPQASVRAEKNRCARNCFTCPCCTNTLSVVASDPPNTEAGPSSTTASIGEPPYYLSCLSCRWDSKSIGIVFEKPTGLAGQLAKLEEEQEARSGLSASMEYENIREHVEPYLRAGLAGGNSGHSGKDRPSTKQPTSAIAAAARALSHSNQAMNKDIPSSIASANRFNSLHNLAMMHRSSSSKTGLSSIASGSAVREPSTRDHLVPYTSKQSASDKLKGKGKESAIISEEKARVEATKKTKKVEDLATLQQRWTHTYNQALLSKNLRPQRIPLQSKKTKRCHICRHIVVKPDPKAASTKFKIRLVANAYLPQIDVHRRVPPSLKTRLSAAGSAPTSSSSRRSGRISSITSNNAKETLILVGSDQDSQEPLRPGRNYSYQLTFVNPLYESIEVLVEMLEPIDESEDEAQQLEEEEERRTRKKKNWSVTMPGTSFAINAYAEAWEYEGQDEDEEDELPGGTGEAGLTASSSSRKRRLAPGVLAQRANRTVVQLDLVTGREATGVIRIPLYISYTYTAEDTSLSASSTAEKAQDKQKTNNTSDNASSNLKSFSFWTSVMLGTVVPRSAPVGAGERRVPSSSGGVASQSATVASSATAGTASIPG